MWTYADVPKQNKPREIKTWHYKIRRPDTSCYWADVWLDSTGFFATISDCGNWINRWSYHGCKDFRKFFLRIEEDYFCNKVARKDTWDQDGTIKRIKEVVCEKRRCGGWTKKRAREEWEFITYLEDGLKDTWYSYTSLEDASEYFQYSYTGHPEWWHRMCLPYLQEAIREELRIEAGLVA